MEPNGAYVRTNPISEIPQEDKAQVSRVSKPILFFMVFALLPYKTIERGETAKRTLKKGKGFLRMVYKTKSHSYNSSINN
jgi:hypothetical protein